jgi:hypothetical protein
VPSVMAEVASESQYLNGPFRWLLIGAKCTHDDICR